MSYADHWADAVGRYASRIGAALLALLATPAAFASDAVSTTRDGIETIVVTAQKVAQDVLDVGMNVSATSGDDLRERHVDQFRDMAGLIPNFEVHENSPGIQPKITIRGVGLNEFSSTNNPSAGIYVDEMFLASLAMLNFDFYDIERVEVLKGPQGTLYGRNSTAGAINIITAKPRLDATSVSVWAGYGNYETTSGEAMVNLPLGDSVALRAAARVTSQNDGYWQSRGLDSSTGERDAAMGRLQLLWEATDAVAITLKLDALDEDGEIGQGEFFGTNDFTNPPTFACAALAEGRVDFTCTDYFGYSDTDGDPFEGDWNTDPRLDTSQWTALARMEWDLGATTTLTSVTGYIDFERNFYVDADASPLRQAEFDQSDEITEVSQELRLSGGAGRTTWVTGVFYSQDEVDSFTPAFFNDLFLTEGTIASNQETESAAAFGQAEWSLTDTLSAVTGVRYTWERKDYEGGTTDDNPFGVSCLLSPTCTPGFTGPMALSFLDDSISDRNWSWRAGLHYKPGERSLGYVSVSRGAKSGGYFNGVSTQTEALLPYDPEQLTAYEIGWKLNAPEHDVAVSASVFYYDYQDHQAFQFTDVGAVSLLKIDNIDEAELYGLDLDVTWMPLAGLTLTGALGLLDTELGGFVSVGPAGPLEVPKGNEMPNAPEVTFATLARYERSLAAGLMGMVQVDGRYADESFKDTNNTGYLAAGSYWIWNAQGTIGAADGRWEVALWVKNVDDERYLAQAADNGIGMGWRMYNMPRTYGTTFRYNFGS